MLRNLLHHRNYYSGFASLGVNRCSVVRNCLRTQEDDPPGRTTPIGSRRSAGIEGYGIATASR